MRAGLVGVLIGALTLTSAGSCIHNPNLAELPTDRVVARCNIDYRRGYNIAALESCSEAVRRGYEWGHAILGYTYLEMALWKILATEDSLRNFGFFCDVDDLLGDAEAGFLNYLRLNDAEPVRHSLDFVRELKNLNGNERTIWRRRIFRPL